MVKKRRKKKKKKKPPDGPLPPLSYRVNLRPHTGPPKCRGRAAPKKT